MTIGSQVIGEDLRLADVEHDGPKSVGVVVVTPQPGSSIFTMESAANSLGWQHRGMQERPTKRASKKFKGGAAKNRQTP